MVRAGAVRSVEQRRRLIIIAVVFVVVLLVAFFVIRRSGSSDTSGVKLSNFKVSEALAGDITSQPFATSQPTRVPENFYRTDVNIVSALASNIKCEEVLQKYNGTHEKDRGYIDIYSYPATCSFPRPDDAETFKVGDYSGWVSDSDKDQSVLFELTVNQAIIRVETSLTTKQITPVLKKFVPFIPTPPKATIVLSK